MSRISRDALARAIACVDAMNTPQQEDLADEIFKAQPNMFGSILALRKMGVPADRMDFPVKMHIPRDHGHHSTLMAGSIPL